MDLLNIRAHHLRTLRVAEQLPPDSPKTTSFLADMGRLFTELPAADRNRILAMAGERVKFTSWEALGRDRQWAVLRACSEWVTSPRTTGSGKA